MADEILIIDATASNIDGTDPGSPLTIGPGTSYNLMEHDYPAAPLNVQYASSIDTEGELPVSSRYGNRTITIKLEMVDAAGTLLAALQGKFGKLQREGGTLKRTMKNGDVRIYDIIAADGWSPVYTLQYYLGDLTEVTLTLQARPLSRGAEVDLGDNVETTLPVLIFTDTGVLGDAWGLARLVTDNDDASNAQRLLRWGIQSRYYSSASTAALFYQAESCAMSAAAAAVGPAGASGGGSNTAFYGSLPATGSWSALHYIGASSTAQTHIGTFRVLVRAWAPAANSGIVSLRAAWQPGIGRTQVTNDGVPLTDSAGASVEDAWLLVDLGQISIPKAATGTQGWLGTIQANSTTLNDDVYIDWVALVPVDEGSGEHCEPDTSITAQITTSGTAHIRYDGAYAAVSGGYVTQLNKYEGDYLLIPPAGAEARTLRVIVKMSRGTIPGFSAIGSSEVFYDPGTDDISARLFVTPRYLT